MRRTPVRVKDLIMKWLAREWNRPDRSDYYAMQIAAEIRALFSNKPVKLDQFHVSFTFGDAQQSSDQGMTKEKAASIAKAKWIGRFGGNVRHVVKDKHGNVISDTGQPTKVKSQKPPKRKANGR